MKKLSLLAAAGLMAVLLTGCDNTPKQPEVKTEVTTQHDAAGQPAEATTTTTTTDGATSQE